MKRNILFILLLLLIFISFPQGKAYAPFPPKRINIEEEDGDPDGYPHTLKFPNTSITDNTDQTYSVDWTTPLDLRYLKLDQSTPQTVINDAPVFDIGIDFSDDAYIGLGVAAGRIEFDDQTTDEINFLDCLVGIGTTTPSELLHIKDGDLLIDGETSRITLYDSGTGEYYSLHTGDATELSGFNNLALIRHNATTSNFLMWWDDNDDTHITNDLNVGGTSTFDSLIVDTDTLVANVSGYEDKVGIGTATPEYPLHIVDDIAVLRLFIENTTAGQTSLDLKTSQRQFRILNDSRLRIFDQTANADRISISATGLVGIGDLSADYPFEILSLTNPQWAISNTDGVDYATFGVDTDGQLDITTVDGGGAGGHICLMPDGFVGIGTATPDSLFEVDGPEGLAIETVTGDTTLDNTHSTLLVNASGNVTITLPTSASSYNNTDGIGRIYEIKKIDADANTVTVDGNGSETIDGGTTAVITTQYEAITIQADGSNWHII